MRVAENSINIIVVSQRFVGMADKVQKTSLAFTSTGCGQSRGHFTNGNFDVQNRITKIKNNRSEAFKEIEKKQATLFVAID